MTDNKKYYYLKLKDNFFDSEEIKVLESMENGYKYSNILLKMYLKSLKREGLLMFKDKIPYNPKMIATVTGHNVNDVKQALYLFDDMDLIEVLSNGAIYMMDIQNYIGTSSTEADRIRAYRNEIEKKKEKLLQGETVDLNVDVTNVQQLYDNSTPEKEIEKELELKKENKDNNSCSDKSPNEKSGDDEPKFDEDSEPYKAAVYLRRKVNANHPKQPTPDENPKDLEDWAVELDRLNRLGTVGAEDKGYSWEEIYEIMMWCQDHHFWKNNIMSAYKFRKQIVQLEAKMKEDKGGNNGENKVSRDNQTEEEREYGEEVNSYFQF